MKLSLTQFILITLGSLLFFSCSTEEPSKTSIAEIDSKFETLYQADSTQTKEAVLAIAEIDASGDEKKYLAEKSYNYVVDFVDEFHNSYLHQENEPETVIIIDAWSDNIAFDIIAHRSSNDPYYKEKFDFVPIYDENIYNAHDKFSRKVSKKIKATEQLILQILLLLFGSAGIIFAVRNKKKKHVLLILGVLISWFSFTLLSSSIIGLFGVILYFALSFYCAFQIKFVKNINSFIRVIAFFVILTPAAILLFKIMHWPGAGQGCLVAGIAALLWLIITCRNFKIITIEFSFTFIFWIFCAYNFWSLASGWF